jgi:hypothetical protein
MPHSLVLIMLLPPPGNQSHSHAGIMLFSEIAARFLLQER